MGPAGPTRRQETRSVAISASDVKALREATGAGMMDCKKALTEAEGDSEKALEVLRERGLAKAGKRAGRATSEGAIAISTSGAVAAIVDLGCETDFVAKTDTFQDLAREIADAVAADASVEGPEQALAAKLATGSVEDRVTGEIAESVEMVLPLVIGEFAPMGPGGVEAIPYKLILEEAEENQVGWLAWS